MTIADLETAICNRALSAVGTRSTIASLTEASNEANQCNLLFDSTRDELLAMAGWNFARKYDTLTLLKSAPGTPENPTPATVWSDLFPPPPWAYEYSMPTDCVQALIVISQWDSGVSAGYYWPPQSAWAQFIVASDVITTDPENVILTNARLALLAYTFRNENPASWSNGFIQSLVLGLAGKLAVPLTGDKQLAVGLFQQANQYVIQARADNANEGITIIDPPVDWLIAREGDVSFGADSLPVISYGPLFAI